MNDQVQDTWLENMKKFYSETPFQEEKQPHLRYYYNNTAYAHNDAIMLYTFIRALQPKNIVEVGSGYTSAAILDTIDLFVSMKPRVTFIEPYPDVLHRLLSKNDLVTCTLKKSPVQDIPIETFLELQQDDILFIDSTHVSKIGSDVNYLFFEILPRLNPGVYVHIHDVFFPFEYPESWVIDQARFWNEDYLLRAFLTHNDTFEIVFFNDYYHRKNPTAYEHYPTCMKNGGGSLWLRKKNS
jgi:predicted O-methyltransferase YrrM